MIRLGEVNFTLGADTRDLQRSVQTLHQFGTAVDQVSTQTVRSANQTAAAFRKQEQAVVSALNSTLKLTQQMRKVEGTGPIIDQASRAFQQLNTYMTAGERTTLQYQRAMERFRASTGNAVRGFKEFTNEQLGAAGKGKYLANTLKGLQSSMVFIQGPLGGVATRISTLGSLMTATGTTFTLFAAGALAAGIAVYKLGQSIFNAGKQAQAFTGQFQAVTGNMSQAEGLLEKITGVARKTGQAVTDLAPAFARFSIAADGSGMTMKEVERAFVVLASTSTKLQMGQEQSLGIFKALEQMMSKSTVQAEELRGQLGDRLPGAIQIMARALGVSTVELQKMMKAGEVLSATAIPKFIEELARTLNITDKPINNVVAAVNNLSTAWFQLMSKLDKFVGITNKAIAVINFITDHIDAARYATDLAAQAFRVLGDYATVAFRRMSEYFAPLIQGFQELWAAISAGSAKMFGGMGKQAGLTWAAIQSISYKGANDLLGIFYNLNDAIPLILSAIPSAVGSIVVQAMNVMIAQIEDALNTITVILQEKFGQFGPDLLTLPRITDTFAGEYAKISTKIKNIMEREQDILGDTSRAWRQYQEEVDSVGRNRSVGGQAPQFLGGIGSPGTPFELDPAKVQEASELTEKEIKALARKEEALKAINDELERTYEEISALGSTEGVMQALTDQFKRDKEVEKYAKALRRAGVETSIITQKTRELAVALERRDLLQNQFDAVMELRDSFVDAFDQMGDAVLDLFEGGEDAGERFKKSMLKMANELLDTFIKMALFNPLKNWLFGTNEPTFDMAGGIGNAFKQALPGLFGKSSGSFGTAGAFGDILGTTNFSAPRSISGIGSPSAISGGSGGTVTAMIRQAAANENIDPNVFLRVAKSEGGLSGFVQSSVMKNGIREPSWGPMQLLKGGPGTGFPLGMGNQMMRETGLDPANPANMQAGINFAAKQASQHGWGQWYGAKAAGIGKWEGIGKGSGVAEVEKYSAALTKSGDVVTKFGTTTATATNGVGSLGASSAQATAGLADAAKGLSGFGQALQGFMGGTGGAGASSGWFQGLSSMFGGSGGAIQSMLSISPMATMDILSGAWGLFGKGGVFGRSGLTKFGRGGVTNGPSVFPFANGIGMMGEAGDEAIMPLSRGPGGKLGVNARGGGLKVTIRPTVYNNSNASVRQEQRTNNDGSIDLITFIDQAVADRVSTSGSMTGKAMRERHGIRPTLIRRG